MVTAIVLAAGSGSRMKSTVKKQYMSILGKPLVYYSLKAFNESEVIDNIIVVTGEEDITYMKSCVIDEYHLDKVTDIVAGGKERYNSVYNGLMLADKSDYVLVHDGARPCIATEQIEYIVQQVKRFDACVAGVLTKDTIKIVDDSDNIVETPNRSMVWLAQTPQAFKTELLVGAYEEMMRLGDDSVTDDSMVIEKYSNINVKMVECSYDNIKVTTPEDIAIARNFLNQNQ